MIIINKLRSTVILSKALKFDVGTTFLKEEIYKSKNRKIKTEFFVSEVIPGRSKS